MKKLIFIILPGIFSCDNDQRSGNQYPPVYEELTTWTVYEGRVPLNHDDYLYMELSMLPGDRSNEGTYELAEFLEEGLKATSLSSFKGKYSTLRGENLNELIVLFHNSARSDGLKRIYTTRSHRGAATDTGPKIIREEPFRKTDLALKTAGDNKLLVLDDHLRIVSDEREHNLIRRNSRLFTVEGYFRHKGDTADFFEMNTGEMWAVTKLGDYNKAIRQYHLLTNRKFEVTHIKGIAYSVRHINKAGEKIEALTIKKVIQMTTSTAEFPGDRSSGKRDL
ncbi:MAG TPA: hypothetical protein VIQ51_02310 [Chryseosolibacter sp.]|jgi:hypothetical protein